ncbi:uncharacterized protein LOC129598773 [Paramacrobiotus metropolitanus]|uniref:uncharacterized protein LOC129598773 n=1 Tax=Paramacrobiotus metropolitanus TaxID=2943436 RepID=UPI002445E41F|nr:uncharacterized protein LOC129598773 [Paramacrobiotus metropolitanus]
MAAVCIRNEAFGRCCDYCYRPEDCIAKGGYGTVYKAKITEGGGFTNENIAAVKVVHLDQGSEILAKPENWMKLRNSLKGLIDLSHDHLVAYHKIKITGSLGGASIELMMDYYPGTDMERWFGKLRSEGLLLDEAEAIRYAMQITKGLQFLHKEKIIHADLKPKNILVRQMENGNIRLVIGDLDEIVKMQRDVTCSQDITRLCGTVRYMSPEMLKRFVDTQNAPISVLTGRKVDIWSLGCIILELAGYVIGRHEKQLCRGLKTIQAGCKITDAYFASLLVDGYVPLVSEYVPANLAKCIRNCLHENPADRQDADQALQSLVEAEKEAPKEVIVLIHCENRFTNLAVQVLIPSANILHPFPLPTELQTKVFWSGFGESNNMVICQVMDEPGAREYKTLAWDLAAEMCYAVSLSDGSARMTCPITVRDKVYFWDLTGLQPQFKAAIIPSGEILQIPFQIAGNGEPGHMSRPFFERGVRFGNKLIYIFGRSFQSTKSMWIGYFDTDTYTWHNLPDMPGERRDFALAVLQGTLYIIGGLTVSICADYHVSKSCLRLDIQSPDGGWQEIHDLPQPRTGHCAFVLNNRIHVFGGRILFNGTSSILQTMEFYDRDQNKWTNIPFKNMDSRSHCGLDFSYAVNLSYIWPACV